MNYWYAADDVFGDRAKVPERRRINSFAGPGTPQQNMNCTLAGTCPDRFNRLAEENKT